MRLLRIVPDNTKFDFMRFRRVSFPISAALSIVAIVLFFHPGLNLGIDFRGGTLMEVQAKSGVADLANMRATLNALNLGDVQLQQFGAPSDVLIRISEQPGGDAAQQVAVAKVRTALGDGVEYRRVEVVGPRVSGELLSYGTLGIIMAICGILLYLWFRFEWQFALGAMIANVHDLVLTIGFMSLTQIDFDLTSIAALLTILGYSLNDTVVIYDRIREMLRRYKKLPMTDLLNASVNSTLSRSIITHVTVTLALMALLLFGGQAIHSFTATMMFGVVLVGTYTSVFIASPILIYLGVGTGRIEFVGKLTAADAGYAASAACRADRRLRQWRISFRRNVASRLHPVPAERHLGVAAAACRPDRGGRPGAGLCRGRGNRPVPAGHRARTVDHAGGIALAVRRPSHRGRGDADRRRAADLQYRSAGGSSGRCRIDHGGLMAPPRYPADMQDAATHCEDLVRQADKDRFLATLFAPADRRDDLHALYAFDIEVATIRDRAREPLPGELRLQWWREVVEGDRPGEATAHPVAAALLAAMTRHALPVAALVDVIEARAFDLYADPMPTLSALNSYGRRTTAVLIGLAAAVLGPADHRPADLVDAAGAACAITGLLRSFALHASRGQLFVPLEVLERHGVGAADVLAGHSAPNLRAALKDMRDHVRHLLAGIREPLAAAAPEILPALLPAGLVIAYLDRMERRDYDPFASVVDVAQWRRQWLLWRCARRGIRV